MIYAAVSAAISTTVSTVSRAALCALLGLCLLAGLLPRAGASTALPTFTVTRTADDTAPGSLRSAIAQAAAVGGVVNFQILATDPGVRNGNATITLSLGPLVVPSSLSIVGPNMPSGAITVSGGTGANQSRVFSVTGGTVSISNLTITNGNALQSNVRFPEPEGGGGILNTATLTLTNCAVTASVSDANGGGIANSGTLIVNGIGGIGGNTAGGSGGGLFNTGTATLNGNGFGGNTADTYDGTPGGGGAYNTGALTLNGCSVGDNFTFASGGGLLNSATGSLTLNACILSGNEDLGEGGGAITNFGTAQITNCLVVINLGYAVGGLYNGGSLTLINSTFTGNTVVGSSDTPVPSALGLYSGPATLINDIFYFDARDPNSNLSSSEIVAASGTAGPTVTYSDVQQANGVYPGTGNVNADPLFVRNPQSINIYTDLVSADSGDEHLRIGSPAGGTGTNGPGFPLTDIEGTPRPTPPARPSMGAYELSGTSSFNAQGGFSLMATQNQSTGTQVVATFFPGPTPGASFTATVDFGDGSGPMAATISPDPAAPGVFQVTGSHTYTTYGTFTITVVISGPGGTPTATVTSTATIQPAQIAVDVTSQVSVFRGGFIFNRATRRYVQTVTITNTGGTTITGPISLVLDNLIIGADLFNPAGTTQYVPPTFSRYQNAPAATLAPGASTTVVLQLTYVGTTRLDYTPRVLAGPGAR